MPVAALLPTLLIAGVLLLILGLRDSGVLRNLRVPSGKTRWLIFVPLFLLQLRYVHWRLTETIPPFSFSVEGLWPAVFLVFEMSSMVMLSLTYLTISRKSDRTPEVEKGLELLRDSPVKVALLIPTYNEPKIVLQRTIFGAMSQNQPGIRVYVLDDSRRDWLRDYCAEVGVGYCRRDDNHGAKAGNMNAGLASIRRDGFEPDFVGILDADFVARPEFIHRCLALHMLHPEAGIVQTPQHFFNPDPIQMNLTLTGTAPDEQRFFFDELLPAKDAWGTAFSCGTSSLVRVRALDAIGGFPTESVTEDMLMSLRMRERGWQTLYLNEVLTFGLSPEGCGEYTKQRHRWCLGFIQIFRDIYNPFSLRHRLGLMDRIHIFDTFLYWGMSFPARYLFLLAPAVYWATGWLVIDSDLSHILLYLAPWLVAHMLVMTWISRGSLQPILNDITQLLVGRAAIHATLTGLFSSTEHKFVVTPKGELGNEVHVDWHAMTPILVLIAINLGSILIAAFPGLHQDFPVGPRMINLFWMIINLMILALTALSCVELPRRRTQERILMLEPVACSLHVGDDAWPAHILDLSLSGCSVRVDPTTERPTTFVGERAILKIGQDEAYGLHLVRKRQTGHGGLELGCAFTELSLRQQLRLTERIFYESEANLGFRHDSVRLMGRILRNLWQHPGHR